MIRFLFGTANFNKENNKVGKICGENKNVLPLHRFLGKEQSLIYITQGLHDYRTGKRW